MKSEIESLQIKGYYNRGVFCRQEVSGRNEGIASGMSVHREAGSEGMGGRYVCIYVCMYVQ